MDACDKPTIVNVKGKPKTKIIKNKDAKTIALMFVHAGICKDKDITFTFPNSKKIKVDLVQRKKYGGHQINNIEIGYNSTIKSFWKSTAKQCKNLPKELIEKYAYITLSEN